MSLMTEGEAPGPVRFYLACDDIGCPARAVFDLVIDEPPPPIEEDLFAHVLHSSTRAAPYIERQGWTFTRGIGYWCPDCSTPRSRRTAPPRPARRSPVRRRRRDPKGPQGPQ
ncbi:hypothetical protein [Streptomyces sp. WMMB 714]|uniref:hypothetical protein n=1 Tax=Streptomyces sp. WMMB 714 TaxID=1286822 RepID=UPI0005F86087|nr:hypothetical protein [Streptomyces sp. WMMB 714]